MKGAADVEDPTVTMREIADIARVRRAVVSMWRRRSRVRGRIIPFPEPVRVEGGVERFRRDEIIAWLTDTDRGNNPEAALDAKAAAVPTGVESENVVVLLSVYARAGGEFANLSSAELVAVTRQIDPDDEFALSEVRTLGEQPYLLRYADDLIENSFGATNAYERLVNGRLAWQSGPRGLTPHVIDLVAALTRAAHEAIDKDAALAVPDDQDLAWRLWESFTRVQCCGQPAAIRAQRRRAVIRGLDVDECSSSEVRVISVVGQPDRAALDIVSEADVALRPGDVVIVIGAASLLCDPLVGDREKERAYILRLEHLALALRLPRGLWKDAHRQAAGIWVLQGGRTGQTLRMADLSTEALDLDDLCSDLTAALQDNEHRAFRYARVGNLAPVLAGGAVVPRGIRAVSWGRSDISYLDRVYAATLTTSEPIPGFDITAAAAPGHVKLSVAHSGNWPTTS